jgi:hypothetical protein
MVNSKAKLNVVIGEISRERKFFHSNNFADFKTISLENR